MESGLAVLAILFFYNSPHFVLIYCGKNNQNFVIMDCSDDLDDSQSRKFAKRKRFISSRGNKSTMGNPSKRVSTLEPFSDDSIVRDLHQKCPSKCLIIANRTKEGYTDWNKLINDVRDGRLSVVNSLSSSYNEILYRLFKNTITNPPRTGIKTKVVKFSHNWSLPCASSLQCRHCWGIYHGFSKYSIDKCAADLKKKFEHTGAVTESYSDSKVFNYTYDQVEQIIQEEVVDENGEHLLISQQRQWTR